MNMYDQNRSWSDQFLPDVKRIVGQHLLTEAPNALDWHQATDLLTLDARDTRIAARIRRAGYAEQYPHEFTVRAASARGGPTELAKIVNGRGDWMFYGHASPHGQGLASWYIIDLRAFRAGLIRHMQDGYPLRFGDKLNVDGTGFRWFDIRSFPQEPRLVVASG